ncbi:inositol-trisphosphate 3-kinase B-like [Lepisosteus oculatus]|uniref:inositol-trisphosphate 3-kinase B-like n=1 Tax=Lepisosteus oculatus TaxID=7918 RepID=UPI0035F4FF55
MGRRGGLRGRGEGQRGRGEREGAGRDIDGARRGAEGAGREGEGEERGAEGTGRSGLGEEAVGERGTEKRWKGLGGGGERAWRQQRGRGRRVGGSEGDRLGALTRTLQHSSASSSSSFNCSSAESDEVFSEDEEGAAKRKVLRKCRSLKTFFTMMQWSLRRQNSWVQLAGHEGNFCPSGGGEVLKRFSVTEGACLQSLMSDVLRPFVPQYRGPTTRGGQTYLRLEDLLSGLDSPVIMDCKMGVRTYLEEELTKARLKPCPRRDMYQKMVKVDPAAPTADEHAQQAVTKPRYMQWRETISSTATLGFRIEGITMEAGKVLRDFKKTRTPEQIIEAILAFTRGQTPVLEAYLSRLNDLRSALPDSVFFHSHELIGSSLLFVHDLSGRANVWMIDFGKTTPAPPSLALQHDVPWTEGSREDGYLIGLAHLTSIVGWALERSRTGPGPGSSAESDQDFRTAPEPSPVPPRPADDGTGPRPRQGHT